MARIRILSEGLVNQIAAGEVVERPASVLKELGENALDAGARAIRVRVRGGGVELLEVSDDGCGMSRDDAARSLLRHATSKLQRVEDLAAIGTLGFRGEALAAIASVARLELVTCEPGAAAGTRLTGEGGRFGPAADAPPVAGTVVRVEDLFFNVPARRKFLKKDDTEQRHVEEAVVRLALGHPDVAFSLEVDGQRRFELPAGGDPRERLVAAIGPEVLPHLLTLDERRLGLEVRGFVASPELTLSNARGLYAFVNRRYVRDRGITSAVQRALGAALPQGRQPVAAVFIELDPTQVDVNVHPQKTEVRFQDPRGVAEAVHAAVTRALRAAPWNATPPPQSGAEAVRYADAVQRFLDRARVAGAGEPSATPFAPGPMGAPAVPGSRLGFGQALPEVDEAAPPGWFSALRGLGPLGPRFVALAAPGGGLVVLDLHAAHERLQGDALWKAFRGKTVAERGLGGGTVAVRAEAREKLLAAAPWLERLGLEVEAFGGDSVAVRSLPPTLLAPGSELAHLLADVVAHLPELQAEPTDAAVAPVLRFLACRAAYRLATETGPVELRAILARLDETPAVAGALHGRVIAAEISGGELLRRADGKP